MRGLIMLTTIMRKIIKSKDGRDSYSISIARKEDIDEILAIKKEAHDLTVFQNPELYKKSEMLFTDNLLNAHFETDNKAFLLLKKDDKLIGYLMYEIVEVTLSMMVNRKYLYVEDFAITKEYRKKGYGSMLFSETELLAEKLGANCVELAVRVSNRNAFKFYRKKGFHIRACRMYKNL